MFVNSFILRNLWRHYDGWLGSLKVSVDCVICYFVSSFCSLSCPLASWKFVSKSSRCLVLRNKNWSVRWVCLSTFRLHVGMGSAFFFEQLWWWRCVLQTRRKVWKYATVSPVSLRYFAKVVKVVRGTFTQVVWMQNLGDVYRREG